MCSYKFADSYLLFHFILKVEKFGLGCNLKRTAVMRFFF